MAYVASHIIEEVTAQAQSNSLEGAREICADGTYFPNNLRTMRRGEVASCACEFILLFSVVFLNEVRDVNEYFWACSKQPTTCDQ